MVSRPIDAYGLGDLDTYYRDCVVGGPGAFTLAVTNRHQFEGAIRRKLIQEIAAVTPRIVPAAGDDKIFGGRRRDGLPDRGEKARARVAF
jgi:hypothetical protein